MQQKLIKENIQKFKISPYFSRACITNENLVVENSIQLFIFNCQDLFKIGRLIINSKINCQIQIFLDKSISEFKYLVKYHFSNSNNS